MPSLTEQTLYKILGDRKTIPKELRNVVVARSRKGRMGQIVVRKFTGVQDSRATRWAREFEEKIQDSPEGIAEKLEASLQRAPSQSITKLVELIRNPGKGRPSFANLVARSGADLAQVVTRYAEGAAILSSSLALIEVAKDFPRAARDMIRQAVVKHGKCYGCMGSGKVPSRQYHKNAAKDAYSRCQMCDGGGEADVFSPHYEFAVENSLKVMKLLEPPKGPTVNVQQNVGVAAGGDFMAKLLKTSDKILYGRDEPVKLPPAEVSITDVLPETSEREEKEA